MSIVVRMSARQERIAKETFLLLVTEAQKLGMVDMLMLKSAGTGKLTFEELPDRLRQAFARIAFLTFDNVKSAA